MNKRYHFQILRANGSIEFVNTTSDSYENAVKECELKPYDCIEYFHCR